MSPGRMNRVRRTLCIGHTRRHRSAAPCCRHRRTGVAWPSSVAVSSQHSLPSTQRHQAEPLPFRQAHAATSTSRQNDRQYDSAQTDPAGESHHAAPWPCGTRRTPDKTPTPSPAIRRCRRVRGPASISSSAKITMCAMPLANCPLYIAPTPGIRPSSAASTGCGLLPSIGGNTPSGGGYVVPNGLNRTPPTGGTVPATGSPAAAPAGAVAASRTSRQGSQNTPEPTVRIVSRVSGRPQSWQNPTRSLFPVSHCVDASLMALGSFPHPGSICAGCCLLHIVNTYAVQNRPSRQHQLAGALRCLVLLCCRPAPGAWLSRLLFLFRSAIAAMSR